MKDNVLVYGRDARSHCLAEGYARSPHVGKVFVVPENDGINYTSKGKKGIIVSKSIPDYVELAKFCKENNVVLVDIGPEGPLDNGLVDVLDAKGIGTVGPLQEYVILESDREYTDNLLKKIGVPKPEFAVFEDPQKAKSHISKVGYQVVVKNNWLAEGKGAIVCDDEDDAFKAVDDILVKKIFVKEGDKKRPKIVIEERKYGTEISFYVYLDGKNAMPLRMFAQDYKPACDPDDKELIKSLEGNVNTGGVGAYCPHKLASPWLINRIIKEIVNPTVNEIYNNLGWKYKGVLYFGLNLDPFGDLDVFELNVRHGDPEGEVLLRKLKTDMFELGMAVWEGKLDKTRQEWNDKHYVDVVAMTGRSKDIEKGGWYAGYPRRYGRGYKVTGLEKIDRDVAVFFTGVKEHKERGLVTDGGRVLHVVGGDVSLEEAVRKTYDNIKKIEFLDYNNNNQNCMRFRKTIGM